MPFELLYTSKVVLLVTLAMGILESIAGILVVLWLAGFALHIAGGLIHVLLVIAVILIALRFLRQR